MTSIAVSQNQLEAGRRDHALLTSAQVLNQPGGERGGSQNEQNDSLLTIKGEGINNALRTGKMY